jgi:hypothetical protein
MDKPFMPLKGKTFGVAMQKSLVRHKSSSLGVHGSLTKTLKLI